MWERYKIRLCIYKEEIDLGILSLQNDKLVGKATIGNLDTIDSIVTERRVSVGSREGF